MNNKAYHKSIRREIRSSKARFLSILVIILLGVAFYSGIKATGPNLNESIEAFYDEHNLMDTKIVSTLGLTEKDLDLLKENKNVSVRYGSHTVDANLTNLNRVVRFMEYDSKIAEQINGLVPLEGRLPVNPGEIALDEQALKDSPELKIGDKFIIDTNEETLKSFNKKEFKIVGIVRSPMYIEKAAKGTTSVGKGTIDYFAVVNSKDLSMDAYSEIYVNFENVSELNAYSDEYKATMEENTKQLEAIFANRGTERVEEIKEDSFKEINEGYDEILKGENKLQDAKAELAEGRKKLQEGKVEYEKSLMAYENSIESGKTEILANQKKLDAGQKELDDKKQMLLVAQKQLEEGKQALQASLNQLIAQGMDPNQTVEELNSQIQQLSTVVNQLENLEIDIRTTVSQTTSGDRIPLEKIQGWSQTLKQLGVSDFNALLSQLMDNPVQTNIALSLADGIKEIRNEASLSITRLTELSTGLNQIQAGQEKLASEEKRLTAANVQIKSAQSDINQGKSALELAKVELEKGEATGKLELEKAKNTLEQSEIDLQQGEEEIQKNETKLNESREELEEAKKDLNELTEGKYYFFDRNDNPGYSEFNDVVKRMNAIATVFPMFFFIVAILICLTTMARMVEENRTEIGTLKALGYRNFEIAKKYIVYASIATILGSVLGVLVGFNVFPQIIHGAYGNQYALPELELIYYPSYIIQATGISILCTVGAALFVLKVELTSQPSTLMRPKAPKIGKKIFLERIKPLWAKISFNQKVTFRNLFRYKQRMIMTVFGISACMALMITGFGLRDANKELPKRQFNKLWNYQAIVTFEDNYSVQDTAEYEKVLKGMPSYKNSLNIHQEIVTFKKEGMNNQTATVFVPENMKLLSEFVLLNDRTTSEVYKLGNDGVIINEKLARLWDVSVGDTITMTDESNASRTVNISHIAESYVTHSVYMSPTYYEEIFGQKPSYNSQLIQTSETDEEMLASELIDCDQVINVTLISELARLSGETSDTLDIVVVILIISAGGLAFVVLYNLSNINVSERIRELSTIKVLGFYNQEVTMYILRENTILTALGIFIGVFMGRVLHSYVLVTVEADGMMMPPELHPLSYLYSAILTLIFSLIVMWLMHHKLKKVNMIDALKSNE